MRALGFLALFASPLLIWIGGRRMVHQIERTERDALAHHTRLAIQIERVREMPDGAL